MKIVDRKYTEYESTTKFDKYSFISCEERGA